MTQKIVNHISCIWNDFTSIILGYIKEDTLSFIKDLVVFIIASISVLSVNFFYSKKWWYVMIISMLAIIVYIGNRINKLKVKKQITDIETTNSSLNIENKELKEQILSLKITIEDLEKQVGQPSGSTKLEDTHPKILAFFQSLDASLEGLPESDNSFVRTMRMEEDMALKAYGYKFVDYQENDINYDAEYQPIEQPQLIVRAIVDKTGKIAAKGRIYLPLHYGTR